MILDENAARYGPYTVERVVKRPCSCPDETNINSIVVDVPNFFDYNIGVIMQRVYNCNKYNIFLECRRSQDLTLVGKASMQVNISFEPKNHNAATHESEPRSEKDCCKIPSIEGVGKRIAGCRCSTKRRSTFK